MTGTRLGRRPLFVAITVIAGTYDHGSLPAVYAFATIATNTNRNCCRCDCVHTFVLSKIYNQNIMKALIVIAALVALAFVFRVVELLTGRRIKSVGAKSNRLSGNMPKIDITNEAELKEALKYYKDLVD